MGAAEGPNSERVRDRAMSLQRMISRSREDGLDDTGMQIAVPPKVILHSRRSILERESEREQERPAITREGSNEEDLGQPSAVLSVYGQAVPVSRSQTCRKDGGKHAPISFGVIRHRHALTYDNG